MAASAKTLANLHEAVALELTDIVIGVEEQVGETPDGEPIMKKRRASAGELAVAVKFLKDNSTFADAEQSDGTANLKEALARRGRKPTAQDQKDAMRSIGHDLLQ